MIPSGSFRGTLTLRGDLEGGLHLDGVGKWSLAPWDLDCNRKLGLPSLDFGLGEEINCPMWDFLTCAASLMQSSLC